MELLATTHFLSPFGCFELQGTHLGIRRVQLVSKQPCPAGPIPPVLREAVVQLTQYFSGDREAFDLKLAFGDAPRFYQAVWRELVQVPYGHTTTYKAIAEKLGDPNAVRAVGQANRNNPIAIIVPCHRCIAKNGDLQGYFYGLDMKRQLLELENPMSFARQGSLF